MSEQEATPTKLKPRITLSEPSRNLISKWRSQLSERFPGISVSDSDLVDWLLSRSPELVTAKQVAEIKSAFFGEVKELEWKLKQARAARIASKEDPNE